MNRDYISLFFPEKQIIGFTLHDSTIKFYTLVNALLHPNMIILDVGCGRGKFMEDVVTYRKKLRLLRGKVSKVIGLDVDPSALRNTSIDELRLLNHPNEKWPIDDNSIDLIVSDWTLEHVENPDHFFKEISRVLKPGGYLCIRTTNGWGYVALGARIIPRRFHVKVLQYLQKGRREEDIFPTLYRCNTVTKVRRMLKKYGMEGVVFTPEGVPTYLGLSNFLFRLGVLFERFVPCMRHNIFVFAKKKQI